MRNRHTAALAVAVLIGGGPAMATADVVQDWNAHALKRRPTRRTRSCKPDQIRDGPGGGLRSGQRHYGRLRAISWDHLRSGGSVGGRSGDRSRVPRAARARRRRESRRRLHGRAGGHPGRPKRRPTASSSAFERRSRRSPTERATARLLRRSSLRPPATPVSGSRMPDARW